MFIIIAESLRRSGNDSSGHRLAAIRDLLGTGVQGSQKSELVSIWSAIKSYQMTQRTFHVAVKILVGFSLPFSSYKKDALLHELFFNCIAFQAQAPFITTWEHLPVRTSGAANNLIHKIFKRAFFSQGAWPLFGEEIVPGRTAAPHQNYNSLFPSFEEENFKTDTQNAWYKILFKKLGSGM